MFEFRGMQRTLNLLQRLGEGCLDHCGVMKRALRFLREERGGAASLTAVMTILMVLGGVALIVDHANLIHKRDLLKASADATAMSARLELVQLPRSMSDAHVLAHFDATSSKYAQLNVLSNMPGSGLGPGGIAVHYHLDRNAGTVDATVEADVGGTLMAHWLYGLEGPSRIRSGSGVVGHGVPATVVLAIDTSNSM